MSLNNQTTVYGTMTARPLITTFESGNMVARFSVKVTPDQQAGDDARGPQYIRAFAWGNLAQFVQSNIAEGSRMAITGKLVNRTYVDKDGNTRKVTEVEARSVMRF